MMIRCRTRVLARLDHVEPAHLLLAFGDFSPRCEIARVTQRSRQGREEVGI